MSTFDPYGAGMGPAGYAPLDSTSPVLAVTAPVALRYDGAAGDWLLNDEGQYVVGDPVEQGCALALCIPAGSLRYARHVGNTLHEITDLGSASLKGEVEDRVRRAVPLASFLAEGAVKIRSITYEVRRHGGLAVSVSLERNGRELLVESR